ncbi:MAG: hypothetical protein GXO83_00405 [Chlorobi bacterium]|nr:hypothetical protein [Chlorobiota bacterium]
MKTLMKMILLGLFVASVVVACSKDNTSPQKGLISEITGTYTGYFTDGSSLKSARHDSSATAEITALGEDQIQVWCYGHGLDTTLVLDIYENNDSIMVCMTGDAFETEYGHMKGHQMGHGMHDFSGTEWMHHLSDEHTTGDKHYGMFDTINHTFEYTFMMMSNDSLYYSKFHGKRDNLP